MRMGAHITRGLFAALFLSATALAHGSGTGTGNFGTPSQPSFTDQMRRLQNFVDNEVPSILKSDKLSDQDRRWYQRLSDLRNNKDRTPEETREYEQKLNYLAGEFAKHDPQSHREEGGGTGGGSGGGGASGAGGSEQERDALKKGVQIGAQIGMMKALQMMQPPQGQQGQEKKEGGGGGGGSSGGGGAPAGSGEGGELGGARFLGLATAGVGTTPSPAEGGLKITATAGAVSEDGKPVAPKTLKINWQTSDLSLRVLRGFRSALDTDEPAPAKGHSSGAPAPGFLHQ